MEVDSHVPVLLDEVLRGLAIRPDGTYVDATFGRGGHSRRILAALGPGGRLLAMDRDPEAVTAARELQVADSRFAVQQQRFGQLRRFLEVQGVERVDGILFDLGVSSPQFDSPARGFSFQHDGPLDMRMDPASSPDAATWLNAVEERELAQVLRRYGEEPAATRVARAIVRRRAERPILTTADLADVVLHAAGRPRGGRHPATRVFQAIRIFVNRELEDIEAGLAQALEALAAGGRLCVISFHSLEDRIVKRFMRDASRVDPRLAALPVVPAAAEPRLRLVGGAVHADEAEIARNPRARSAVLRVAERLA
ncbi:MAG: 16S rRNA (cytosine(1402)-N(4))-methyltransferase RsmH [Gammaproteobacteria bacterium]|nr:16S rRNA (cytosine(1402)-N(4))-methyltransferase RsmH [Gammaproteobacteria bacterium]